MFEVLKLSMKTKHPDAIRRACYTFEGYLFGGKANFKMPSTKFPGIWPWQMDIEEPGPQHVGFLGR